MFDSIWRYSVSERIHDSILEDIMEIRGVKDIESFINPDLSMLHDPFLMNDMHIAVSRIAKAIKNKEKIYVYGDYDADGLTSAAILLRFFRSLDAEAAYFIPDRFDDGYGLSIDCLKNIVNRGAKLVITTDCGINSVNEVDFLNNHDVDIIITDHHRSIGMLPKAAAIICSTRKDNVYPYKHLSGAGVALRLTMALKKHMNIVQKYEELIVLAAIGTVADIVPLDGENRIIVSTGISLMKKGICIGVQAILENAAVKKESVNSNTIGFAIGPRINAAGRMGDANSALKLLLTDNRNDAMELADYLSKLNNKRKQEQEIIYEEVLGHIKRDSKILNSPVVIVGAEGLNKGIVGIVASKISELYKKPTIILSIKNENAEGSGRSIGNFSLIEALKYSTSILIKYGGHEKAAGLTLKSGDIDIFRSKIAEYAKSEGYENYEDNFINIDFKVKPDELNFSSIEKLMVLEPFGIKNQKPIFVMERMKLDSYRKIGRDGKHLSLRFSSGSRDFNCVSFNSAMIEPLLFIEGVYDIAFAAEINEFRETRSLQLQIIDFRFADSELKNSESLIVRLLVHMIKYEKEDSGLKNISHLGEKLYKMGIPDGASRVLDGKEKFLVNRKDVEIAYNYIKSIDVGSNFDISEIKNISKVSKTYLAIEILLELKIIKLSSIGMNKYKLLDSIGKEKKELKDSRVFMIFSKTDG